MRVLELDNEGGEDGKGAQLVQVASQQGQLALHSQSAVAGKGAHRFEALAWEGAQPGDQAIVMWHVEVQDLGEFTPLGSWCELHAGQVCDSDKDESRDFDNQQCDE